MNKFIVLFCTALWLCACNEDIDRQNQLQQAALQEITYDTTYYYMNGGWDDSEDGWFYNVSTSQGNYF